MGESMPESIHKEQSGTVSDLGVTLDLQGGNTLLAGDYLPNGVDPGS
jgi:hypothetical protein